MTDNQSILETQTAFIFPGQGSQSLGMLAGYSNCAELNQTFEQASDALGYDLWQLCQNGPAEALNQTDKTQPALLAASVAIWRIWQGKAPLPRFVAGHSLGEYSALVCSGRLNFEQAIKLVEQRGKFMQQAVPAGVGKMAAIIGLDDEKVLRACQQSEDGEIVAPVNYNSPGQIVIAGNQEAVERAMIACKTAGAKRALPLAVSVPSHCALMKPASQQLAESLENIDLNESSIQLLNNVDVSFEAEPSKIKDALVRQLYCPVRWSESIQCLAKLGVTHFVECGPGKVLTGLNRRIDKGLVSLNIPELSSLNQVVEEFI